MASSTRPTTLPTLPELQPPGDPEAIGRTFRGYQMALARMSQSQLLAELARVNSLLEAQARSSISSVVEDSAGLSGYLQSLDRLTLRSTVTDRPSSPPRGRAAQASQTFRPPSPADLLVGSGRLGPRLAAKLVAASARASARRS